MDESKWDYILENWALICKIAVGWKDSAGRFVEYEELISAAMDLAVVCLRSYDKDKGEFSTYYTNSAVYFQRYFTSIKHYRGFGQILSLDQVITRSGRDEGGNKTENEQHAAITSPCVSEEVIDKIDAESLRGAIKKLPLDLQEHALNMLNDKVDWSDVAATRDIQNRTLEALREEMT